MYETAGTYFGVTTFSASECVKNLEVDGEKNPQAIWKMSSNSIVLWNIECIANLII